MKKLRKKRIKADEKQIKRHKGLIKHEKGRLDTTQDYWKKEIKFKFSKQIKKDKGYLRKNKREKCKFR